MADGSGRPRARIIQELLKYREALEEHANALRKMFDDGVLPESVYETETRETAQEIEFTDDAIAFWQGRESR